MCGWLVVVVCMLMVTGLLGAFPQAHSAANLVSHLRQVPKNTEVEMFAALKAMTFDVIGTGQNVCGPVCLHACASRRRWRCFFICLMLLISFAAGITAFGFDFGAVKNLNHGLPRVAQAFAYLLQVRANSSEFGR